MDLSKLSQNDRIALGSAAAIAVTALLSISNAWGALMFLSLAAGVGAIAVILQPMLAPAAKLPVTKVQALVGLGGVATVATGLTALNWLGWIIEHPAKFDTFQFLVGLVAAIVLFVISFQAFKAEREATTTSAA